MKVFYETQATAVGGRSGHTELDDGSLGFDLTAFGSDKAGVNPEQLFALGYAACFDSALNLVAQKMELPLTSSKTSVKVGIGQEMSGAFKLQAHITVYTTGLTSEQAKALVARAHEVCPYSNATRNNIEVTLESYAQ
ncbi:organic hydroperoxide resistance protein [Psittacicella melopsittaci]|uniref:Organic hydroperoxide resistance protein n=1 Tax=Psittacicella melopsittaci TaxID=2028576 RepID=A0A3A1Y5A9_9GAMM|nr:organic hydroperoxide resistance protein [Psittacicella melopsittaci]RIY32775.1 organic hydroperoxide resistance protein [Psittacicella melopsittaci]